MLFTKGVNIEITVNSNDHCIFKVATTIIPNILTVSTNYSHMVDARLPQGTERAEQLFQNLLHISAEKFGKYKLARAMGRRTIRLTKLDSW